MMLIVPRALLAVSVDSALFEIACGGCAGFFRDATRCIGTPLFHILDTDNEY